MNYQDLISYCQQDWEDYTEHDFVNQLATGDLNKYAFFHYLKQDYLFLKHYARAYALAVFKSSTLAEMREPLPGLNALLESEMNHHIEYCQTWGLSAEEMEAEPEDFGTVCYTRYVLDTGMAGDRTDLFTALAPCAIGYAVVGQRLGQWPETKLEGNPYRSWVELYSGEDYQSGVEETIRRLNAMLEEIPLESKRGHRLCEIFKTATRMEVAFWEQGMKAAQ
ncbi:thiaminase II [Photobacterium rosenbergii]|uniref:Aminopyrimidine aminohydrolase n=1 Tax=Photobacterium rosenbergii TaxID=294936 RepID=A0ABU3ZCR2_9GAMM|nr:thiaminase II [Photobacterium rosenbergii]MDV5167709.1 thiaminase II [Photobacterium rosenbergii]